MTIHVGFTGTRFGMTDAQRLTVIRTLEDQLDETMIAARTGFVAHHGDCEGADSQFHAIVLWTFRPIGSFIEVHPGPDGDPHRAWNGSYDRIHPPAPHMKRNAAIVAVSQIMIAAPFEDEPQSRGGTWATIGMARKALKRSPSRRLYVVGRDGALLDHARWP